MASIAFYLDRLTAPGVVLHEFAHRLACDVLGVRVTDVSYLQRADGDGRLGYVSHVVPRSYTKRVLIAVAPFVVNVSVAAGVLLAANQYFEDTVYLAAAYYLGFAVLYHAFPSTGDAETLKPHSWRGYLHPAFILFLPFTVFLLVFTRYVDSWWFSAAFAAAGVSASVLYADVVFELAAG